jgi:parvulin-like peptidyl-prolyl isomerase
VAGQGREEVIKLRHLFFRWGESPDKEERLRVLARANAARAQVAGGEDFGAVAAAVSDGPTAQSGGELGELSRSELLPELSKAAAGLKVMEVSGPIETPNGVHIIRIDAARKKEPPTYEKMRNEIYQQLYQAEVEKQMASWIEELKAQAAIERRM